MTAIQAQGSALIGSLVSPLDCKDIRLVNPKGNQPRLLIGDHLSCLLRNLYVGQETIVRTGHGTTDWFQTGKSGGNRQSLVKEYALSKIR